MGTTADMDKVQHATEISEAVSQEAGEMKQHNLRDMDEAAKWLASAESYPPMTPEQEKRLKKKIDGWMIPLLLFVGTLGAVDKVQISTASLYGFQKDTHMVGQEYSWVGSILPLGMLVGMVPSSYLVHRLPTGKYLSFCSLCWSVLTLMYAACHSWAGIMVLRFLMGMFEAVITPGITLIIAGFYKKSEQPQRTAIILSCFSSVINGFWSWVVGQIPDSAPLAKWRYLYLITGSINVCYSIFILFMLPDSPMNARFLTPQERYYAVQRLSENRTGIASRVWKWNQVLEAILDPKIWLIFLFNIAINIPNGGLITFGSIIIKELGFSSTRSALLTMPTGVMSTISGFVFGLMAAKWHNRRALCVAIALLLPLMGTALVYGLPRSNIAGQMVGLYLMYAYWGPYVVGISLPQANTAGQTKKTVSYSILFLGYAAGNLIGPQTFRAKQAPKYTGGVIAMLSCYCICMLVVGLYWVLCFMDNRRKDKLYGKVQRGAADGSFDELVGGFQDLTDKEQAEFRYIL